MRTHGANSLQRSGTIWNNHIRSAFRLIVWIVLVLTGHVRFLPAKDFKALFDTWDQTWILQCKIDMSRNWIPDVDLLIQRMDNKDCGMLQYADMLVFISLSSNAILLYSIWYVFNCFHMIEQHLTNCWITRFEQIPRDFNGFRYCNFKDSKCFAKSANMSSSWRQSAKERKAFVWMKRSRTSQMRLP